jgi:hypothetical protein
MRSFYSKFILLIFVLSSNLVFAWPDIKLPKPPLPPGFSNNGNGVPVPPNPFSNNNNQNNNNQNNGGQAQGGICKVLEMDIARDKKLLGVTFGPAKTALEKKIEQNEKKYNQICNNQQQNNNEESNGQSNEGICKILLLDIERDKKLLPGAFGTLKVSLERKIKDNERKYQQICGKPINQGQQQPSGSIDCKKLSMELKSLPVKILHENNPVRKQQLMRDLDKAKFEYKNKCGKDIENSNSEQAQIDCKGILRKRNSLLQKNDNGQFDGEIKKLEAILKDKCDEQIAATSSQVVDSKFNSILGELRNNLRLAKQEGKPFYSSVIAEIKGEVQVQKRPNFKEKFAEGKFSQSQAQDQIQELNVEVKGNPALKSKILGLIQDLKNADAEQAEKFISKLR